MMDTQSSFYEKITVTETVKEVAHMRRMIASILIVLFILALAGCSARAAADPADMISELNHWIVEKVEENNEVGISASDIVIDRIYYGSFSQRDANEVLAVCRFLNMPHGGGLDRTACIILSADSLEVVAYREFGADETVIHCLRTGSGENRIFFAGTTTYQGLSAQEVLLFAIRDGEWVELPIDVLNTLEGEYFCFMQNELMIVSSKAKLTDTTEILAIFQWNPDTEQFKKGQ